MTTATFQRARKPAEIGLRRAAILQAAAELFDEVGPDGTGLNAIAARAGFTKSNVYRYFESREAVLLSLFLSDFTKMVDGLETTLGRLEPGNLDAVAHAIAGAFLDHPRVGAFLSILSTVLERNVSEAGVVALKTEMFAQSGRIAAALARALPQLTEADCAWAAAVVGTFVSGLWPAANPAPLVAAVLARPEFAGFKPSAERDLERMILVLLRGLAAAA